MMAKKGFDPKKLMEGFGWEAGKGLGRTESGMKEAIKVRLKMDCAGVGHDSGEQFTFHWWDHVFNSAASSIKVNNTEESVQVEAVGECVISNKKTRPACKDKSMLYGSFVKSATLENGIEEKTGSDSSSESETEAELTNGFGGLTDEQLFEACGGRTAHKGARHGLKLNGKLARIAQQEGSSAANSGSESRPESPRESTRDLKMNGNCEGGEKTEKKRKTKKRKKSKDFENSEVKTKSPKKETNTCKKKRKRDYEKSEETLKTSTEKCCQGNQTNFEHSDLNLEEPTNSCEKKRKKERKEKRRAVSDVAENMKGNKTIKKKKKKTKSSKNERDLQR